MEVDRTFSQWSIGSPRISPRIRWSAVFAGWAVGLALQIVLTLAGLGFGAWAIDLHDANPTEGIPVGAALWTGLSMLASAFVGGYLAARCCGSAERRDGFYHGIVVWGMNWLIITWLTTTAMAMMIGGTFSLFNTTIRSLAQEVPSLAFSRATVRVSLSVDDLRREIESVVRATARGELQPDEGDTGRSLGSARQGEVLRRITEESLADLRDRLSALDRDAAVNLMVNRYRMTDAQARDVVQSTIGLVRPVQDTSRDLKQRSASFGADVLDRFGMMALWLSGLGLISLFTSAVGGILGTAEEALVESTTRTQSYVDIRRAS
jgi:F0F1-type ATP synthase membrane subunit c/vacuolar-type H+-ATPase subunit K